MTPQLGRVILKACRSQLSDRYQTAEELAQALSDCLEELLALQTNKK
jgi:hypothetical protein